MAELTDPQLERYARHVVLDEVGEEGQLRLLATMATTDPATRAALQKELDA